jgi:hypothetical protein
MEIGRAGNRGYGQRVKRGNGRKELKRMRRLIVAVSASLAMVLLAAPSVPASAEDNPPNTCFGQPSPWVKLNGADQAKGTGYVVQNVMVEIDYPNGNAESHLSVNVQPEAASGCSLIGPATAGAPASAP